MPRETLNLEEWEEKKKKKDDKEKKNDDLKDPGSDRTGIDTKC